LLKIYLDSSAIVKRYISEPGTPAADLIFDECWMGRLHIATSIWNIGEVLGVLDVRRRRGWLSEEEFKEVLKNFVSETIKLLHLKSLNLIPVSTSMLIKTWPLILKEHIYEADALQIQACIHSNSNILLTADKELINAATKTGIKAINIENEDKVKKLIKNNAFNTKKSNSHPY